MRNGRDRESKHMNNDRLRSSYLAELADGMRVVVRADQLKVFDRRNSHATLKVETIVALRERRLSCL